MKFFARWQMKQRDQIKSKAFDTKLRAMAQEKEQIDRKANGYALTFFFLKRGSKVFTVLKTKVFRFFLKTYLSLS